MTVTYLDPGTNATSDLSFAGTSGTVTSATDQFHTGSHSYKLASVSGAASKIFYQNPLADAGRRVSFWLRLSAVPDVTTGTLFDIETSAFAGCMGFTITSAGKIAIYDKTYTTQATGTTVLSANTWYRISFVYTITSASVNTITVYINGVSEISATNMSVTVASAIFLIQVKNTSATINGWVSDIFIDDGTSGDTGNISVAAFRPASNGTTNGFSTQIGSGGSGYGSGHSPQVNERPLSQTNGWSMVGAGAAVTEEYTLEARTASDVNITGATIVGLMGWVFAKSLASETGSIVLQGNTSNISLTSTASLFAKVGSNSYPTGGTDIGIVTTTALTTVSLYECGIVIAYIPAKERRTLGPRVGSRVAA